MQHDTRTFVVRRQIGMTLIELMVALGIGAFLMIGAITVFSQSRASFRVNESVARLQENARFAFDALEPDIRMAHYWGLTSRTIAVLGRATAAQAHAGMGAATCGNNWAINLENELGTNNGYGWACAGRVPVEVNADTLIVRRAAQAPLVGAPVNDGTVYIQSTRAGAPTAQIFTGAVPAIFNAATSQTFRLIANGYYVSRSSTLGNNIPSLRRKTLVGGGAIVDEEVLPGVEDMQIQYGVDTDPVGADNRGSVDRYVNANDPILNPANAAFIEDAEIIAIRIWLRIRADRDERGFVDTTNYVYADRNVAAPNDGFRRIVVSKTIYLRNARPPS